MESLLLERLGNGDVTMPAPDDPEVVDEDDPTVSLTTDAIAGGGLQVELVADSKLSLSLALGDVEGVLLMTPPAEEAPLSLFVFNFFFLVATVGLKAGVGAASSAEGGAAGFKGGDSHGMTSATAKPASKTACR